MSDNVRCPMCADGGVVRGQGRLEQSGDTYLPTTVWSCGCCGYVRYEAAPSAQWQAAWPAQAVAGSSLRRAA